MLGRWAADGRRDAVEILLDLGVPVDARGPAGLTALQEATALRRRRTSSPCCSSAAPTRGKRAPRRRARRRTSRPTASSAGRRAQAYLRLLATSPLAESRPCGDGVAVITGVESNSRERRGLQPPRRRRRRGDRRDAALARERDAPAQWLLADPVAPADLRERLVAAGARPERTAVVMGAVLDRLALDDAPPPGLEIAAVRDEAALRAWAQVVEPAEPRARAVEVLASLGLGADAPLQHRLARRDGDVVGAASFLLHGETVLGQQLAVVAPERRAGHRARAGAGVRARGAGGGRARRRGRADAGHRRLLPAAGLRAARVAARPLVLPAAAPRVTRAWGRLAGFARARGRRWRAGPVAGHGLRLRRLRLRGVSRATRPNTVFAQPGSTARVAVRERLLPSRPQLLRRARCASALRRSVAPTVVCLRVGEPTLRWGRSRRNGTPRRASGKPTPCRTRCTTTTQGTPSEPE